MQVAELGVDDFERAKRVLAKMRELANKDNYVLATPTTVYWSVFNHSHPSTLTQGHHRVVKSLVGVLKELGCIQVYEIWNEGSRARQVMPPRPKFVSLVQLTGKELVQEEWDAYWKANEPTTVLRARIASLEAEVASLQAALQDARSGLEPDEE